MSSDVDNAILCFDRALTYLDEGHIVSMAANLVLAEHQLRMVSTSSELAGRIAEVKANLEATLAELQEIKMGVIDGRARIREEM